MNITVIGSGYVGLVTGACFAEMGNRVTCVDIDEKKIEALNRGEVPIYEPGLAEMISRNVAKGHISFTTSIADALSHAEIAFIAVGTPMGEDGSADLQYVLAVASDIGKHMQTELVVVDKSTVPVGTADKVKACIQAELDKRSDLGNISFTVVSNPEFLKEGAAIKDFMQPDRVVVGTESEEAMKKMRMLYAPFFKQNERFIAMDIRSAEMTKYAANAMLATKISFMNEMANICERVGADVNQVRIGIGSDSRIGYSFIYPGIGYGGSCFPKDVQALVKTAADYGYESKILKSVEAVNNRQKTVLLDKIITHYGEDLSGKTFAVWGLSFKPETDDMRAAPSIPIIRGLMERGAKVQAYDPKARHEAESFYLKGLAVDYKEDKYAAVKGAHALLLLTEWKEFRSPDFNFLAEQLIDQHLFDGRNQFAQEYLEKYNIHYTQIGK